MTQSYNSNLLYYVWPSKPVCCRVWYEISNTLTHLILVCTHKCNNFHLCHDHRTDMSLLVYYSSQFYFHYFLLLSSHRRHGRYGWLWWSRRDGRWWEHAATNDADAAADDAEPADDGADDEVRVCGGRGNSERTRF